MPSPLRALIALLALLQAVAGVRVAARVLRSGMAARRIESVTEPGEARRVTVIVPTLDEERRLGPCLDGVTAQGPEVATILVVDGGSGDGTVALAREVAARDARIRVIDAAPVPADWNGKAWNLQRGLAEADPDVPWVLTIDADVHPRAGLAAALLAHAESTGVTALSGATRQRLSGPADGLVHPALLTSLVYRYGIPGGATADPRAVQANGQCMLIRRAALDAVGGFADGQRSVCEDVTIARRLASEGHRVGFAETGGLVDVAMYGSAGETWANWPRSLTMRDQFGGRDVALRLGEVALVQGLPLLVTVAGAALGRRHRCPTGASPTASGGVRPGGRAVALLLTVNRVLTLLRLGVLTGMARAYDRPPLTYWLSPVLDAPVAVRLARSALRRDHRWRGRAVSRG